MTIMNQPLVVVACFVVVALAASHAEAFSPAQGVDMAVAPTLRAQMRALQQTTCPNVTCKFCGYINCFVGDTGIGAGSGTQLNQNPTVFPPLLGLPAACPAADLKVLHPRAATGESYTCPKANSAAVNVQIVNSCGKSVMYPMICEFLQRLLWITARGSRMCIRKLQMELALHTLCEAWLEHALKPIRAVQPPTCRSAQLLTSGAPSPMCLSACSHLPRQPEDPNELPPGQHDKEDQLLSWGGPHAGSLWLVSP